MYIQWYIQICFLDISILVVSCKKLDRPKNDFFQNLKKVTIDHWWYFLGMSNSNGRSKNVQNAFWIQTCQMWHSTRSEATHRWRQMLDIEKWDTYYDPEFTSFPYAHVWPKIWFFDESFDVWRKFWSLTEISIFGQNFDVFPKRR